MPLWRSTVFPGSGWDPIALPLLEDGESDWVTVLEFVGQSCPVVCWREFEDVVGASLCWLRSRLSFSCSGLEVLYRSVDSL